MKAKVRNASAAFRLTLAAMGFLVVLAGPQRSHGQDVLKFSADTLAEGHVFVPSRYEAVTLRNVSADSIVVDSLVVVGRTSGLDPYYVVVNVSPASASYPGTYMIMSEGPKYGDSNQPPIRIAPMGEVVMSDLDFDRWFMFPKSVALPAEPALQLGDTIWLQLLVHCGSDVDSLTIVGRYESVGTTRQCVRGPGNRLAPAANSVHRLDGRRVNAQAERQGVVVVRQGGTAAGVGLRRARDRASP